jgi:hypothetical protein
MIAVEASHAHVIKFLPLHINIIVVRHFSCELSIFIIDTGHFLGEKCGDEDFIYLFLY